MISPISLVSIACVLAAVTWPHTSSAQSVPLVFQTTFDHTNFPDRRPGEHWRTPDGLTDADVGQATDGITGWQGHATVLGNYDRIITAANYSGGGGGKGYRHYRGNGGNGHNDNGGAIHINLPGSYSELWVRFYMRFQLGFHWSFPPDNHPQYTKEFYWHSGQSNAWVFGYQGGAWGFNDVNTANRPSSMNWKSSQGGSTTGDGQWHCYEYHIRSAGANGMAEVWFDNQLVLSQAGVNWFGSTSFSTFTLGSNQAEVTDANGLFMNNGGTPTDWYTDYDDIAISAAGRIGCIGSSVLPAPKNLRFQ